MSHTNTWQRGTRIGYTRVSTVPQTLDQQNEAFAAAWVTKVFSDVNVGCPRRLGRSRVLRSTQNEYESVTFGEAEHR
jgi:hypothetical protein